MNYIHCLFLSLSPFCILFIQQKYTKRYENVSRFYHLEFLTSFCNHFVLLLLPKRTAFLNDYSQSSHGEHNYNEYIKFEKKVFNEKKREKNHVVSFRITQNLFACKSNEVFSYPFFLLQIKFASSPVCPWARELFSVVTL